MNTRRAAARRVFLLDLATLASFRKYDKSVNDILGMLQALADPTRFAIFECVRGCGGESLYDTETGECDAGTPGAIAACEVRCRIPCSESQMSRHFSALRDAGLVVTERRGRKLFAKVNFDALRLLNRHFGEAGSDCLAYSGPSPLPLPLSEGVA